MLWIFLDENNKEEQSTAIPGEDGRAAGGKRQQRRCGQHATQLNTSAHHWRLVLSTHSADQRLLQRGASAGHNTLELGPGEWHKQTTIKQLTRIESDVKSNKIFLIYIYCSTVLRIKMKMYV